MTKHGYKLGGEQSGHIIFSKYDSTVYGIWTSLKVMQAVIDSKKSLSELCSPLKIYPQILVNVRVKSKQAVNSDPEVSRAVSEASER